MVLAYYLYYVDTVPQYAKSNGTGIISRCDVNIHNICWGNIQHQCERIGTIGVSGRNRIADPLPPHFLQRG